MIKPCFILAAAAFSAAATSSSAVTLDFDSGTATINNNVLSQYAQDGLVFSISQTGLGSIGANLFNTLYCLNGSGDAANCNGTDDRDLVPANQGENGVAGNVLIRQESHNNGNQNGFLDDDAATSGFITFTLMSGPAFWIRAFSAVDEQPMQLEVGTEVCGPVDNPGNSDTGMATCDNAFSSMIGVGDSFNVRYAGSGGVDSIQIVPTPVPAGFALLFGGLASLAFWRRRRHS